MFNSYEREYRAKCEEIEEKADRISYLEEKVAKLEKKDLEKTEDHKLAISRLEEKKADELARLNANIDTKIAEATNKLTKDVAKLEGENLVNLEKVSMYEKAFENLGFDVKDMKEILNKLVDGLVSKNQIQLIGNK